MDRGVYAITNLVSAGNGQMRIIANWGRFFDRIQNCPSSESRVKSHLNSAESRETVNEVNPEVQLPRCKATCPTLYRLLTESLDGIMLLKKKGESDYSVCRLVPMTGIIPLLSITKEVLDINRDFVNTMIDICNELSNNPPFPGWKDGLDEVWN